MQKDGKIHVTVWNYVHERELPENVHAKDHAAGDLAGSRGSRRGRRISGRESPVFPPLRFQIDERRTLGDNTQSGEHQRKKEEMTIWD